MIYLSRFCVLFYLFSVQYTLHGNLPFWEDKGGKFPDYRIPNWWPKCNEIDCHLHIREINIHTFLFSSGRFPHVTTPIYFSKEYNLFSMFSLGAKWSVPNYRKPNLRKLYKDWLSIANQRKILNTLSPFGCSICFPASSHEICTIDTSLESRGLSGCE